MTEMTFLTWLNYTKSLIQKENDAKEYDEECWEVVSSSSECLSASGADKIHVTLNFSEQDRRRATVGNFGSPKLCPSLENNPNEDIFATNPMEIQKTKEPVKIKETP